MKRIPPGKRYNARGDRYCLGCSEAAGRPVYLPIDHFSPHRNAPDGLHARCRQCVNAEARRNYARRVLAMSEEAWRAYMRADVARQTRTRRRKNDERGSFVASALAIVRSKGFTYEEIRDLAGISRATMRKRERGAPFRYIKQETVDKIGALLVAASDLPTTGVVVRRKHRPPHPALGLVRARLDRMAALERMAA